MKYITDSLYTCYALYQIFKAYYLIQELTFHLTKHVMLYGPL